MATRLYFPATDAAPVSPAYSAFWVLTANAVRRLLLRNKVATDTRAAGTSISLTDSGTDTGLSRQFVSEPMLAGINIGAMTVKVQAQMKENTAGSDVSASQLSIRVVDQAGTTVQATLFEGTGAGELATELPTTQTNRAVASAQALAAYTTAANDRLVVELGFVTSATAAAPAATGMYGSGSGAATLDDLPEDNTDTGAKASWIEFSGTIGFALTASLSDTITLSEATVKSPTVVVGDTITLTETPTTTSTFVRTASDTITLTEAPAITAGLSLGDTITLSEAAATTSTFVRTVDDTVTFSEAAATVSEFFRTAQDTLTLTEAISKNVTVKRADTIGLYEEAVKHVTKGLSDTITFSDAMSRIVSFVRSLSDTVTFSEATSLTEENISDVPENSLFRLGTLLGLTIGADGAQKLSFHGAEGAAQAAHIVDPTDLASALTAINAILVALENKGLTASS